MCILLFAHLLVLLEYRCHHTRQRQLLPYVLKSSPAHKHTRLHTPVYSPTTTQTSSRGRPGACPWGGGSGSRAASCRKDKTSASPRSARPVSSLDHIASSNKQALSLILLLRHNTIRTGTHLVAGPVNRLLECPSRHRHVGIGHRPFKPLLPSQRHLFFALRTRPPLRKLCLRRWPKRRRTW